jgi:hypothetical protein
MENLVVKPVIENIFQKKTVCKIPQKVFHVSVKPIAKATKIVKITQ